MSIIIKYMLKLSHKTLSPIKHESYFIIKTFTTLLRSLIGIIQRAVSSQVCVCTQFSQIETSSPILPDNRAIQWVYCIWFASSLIISCYFTTTLTSFFAEPGHAEQIKTVTDIIKSNLPISIDELYIYIRDNRIRTIFN